MNVVFDFGGVLFDWRPHAVLARALQARIADEADARLWAARFFEGYGGDWAEFDRGAIEPGALAQRIARRLGLALHEAMGVIDTVPAALQPAPAMVGLLERLHEAGVPLYYLSNMPAPYVLHLEATHAFLGLFRGGVYSSRVRLVKPEPAIFAHAVATLGLEPSRTLFIDDAPANVQAAREAGWQALLHRDAADSVAAIERLILRV